MRRVLKILSVIPFPAAHKSTGTNELVGILKLSCRHNHRDSDDRSILAVGYRSNFESVPGAGEVVVIVTLALGYNRPHFAASTGCWRFYFRLGSFGRSFYPVSPCHGRRIIKRSAGWVTPPNRSWFHASEALYLGCFDRL